MLLISHGFFNVAGNNPTSSPPRQPDRTNMIRKKSIDIPPALPVLSLIMIILFFTTPRLHAAGLGEIRGNLYDCAILASGEVLMVGDQGKIYRSAEGRTRWETVPSGTKSPLFSISFADADHGWIAGKAGLILNTHDGGTTWT